MHILPRGEAIFIENERYVFSPIIRLEGVTLIRAHFRFPTMVPPLYRLLAEQCETWLRSTLAAKAAEESAALPSPKERIHFPYYEYSFSVDEIRREEKIAVYRLTVTLARRSIGELARYESTHTHRLSDYKIVKKG